MEQALLDGNNNSREDTLPQNTPERERTTGDVIIVGNDQPPSKTYEGLFEQGKAAELQQLDAIFSFKAKNELVAQIFAALGQENFQVNIAAVAEILSKEIESEKNRHFQSATELENNTIPLAGTRTVIRFDIPHYYTVHDLDNLQARSDIHTELASRLAKIEASGEDGLFDFAETYVQRVSLEARDQALLILTKQKQELEEKNRQNEAKIEALEDTIALFGTQLEMAHEQVDVRQAPLPDKQTTLRLLAQEAAQLAA